MLILYVLVSLPDHFEGQWPCSRSACVPENGQSPVSAPKGSETNLELLRLYASAGTTSWLWNCRKNLQIVWLGSITAPLRNTFPLTISDSTFCSCRTDSRSIFLMPVFLWNHAHKKRIQNLKSDWNAGRARARKGEAQEFLNGNHLKGIKSNPHIYK